MVVRSGVTRTAPGGIGGKGGPSVSYRHQLSQADAVFRQIGSIVSQRQGRAGIAHEKMAAWIRDRAIQILEDEIQAHGRAGAQRDTHLLIRAMQDPGFARADITGFTINADGFLDKSPAALYWRGVELGSSKFVGREIHGYFKTGDKFAAPSGFRRDTHLIQIGDTEGFKHSTYERRHYEAGPAAGGVSGHTANPQNFGYRVSTEGGTFDRQHGQIGVVRGHDHTFTTEPGKAFYVRQQHIMKRQRTGSKDTGKFFHIVIHNPIPAYHYITRAVEEFLREDVALRIYKAERVI